MTVIFSLFKDSEKSFLAALDEAAIDYNPVAALSTTILASGGLIAIAQTIVSSGAVAAIVVAWLKARASRKVIVTTNENQVVHVEGYSVDEVEKILAIAASVAVIDTEKPNKQVTKS